MAVKTTKHDRVFSRLIRVRDNWTCTVCGVNLEHEPQRLQCSHFSSRKHLRTRWHPINASAKCASCHAVFESRPLEFARWIRGFIGDERADYLCWLTNQPANWRKAEKDEIYEWLKHALQYAEDFGELPNEPPPHMDLEWTRTCENTISRA